MLSQEEFLSKANIELRPQYQWLIYLNRILKIGITLNKDTIKYSVPPFVHNS